MKMKRPNAKTGALKMRQQARMHNLLGLTEVELRALAREAGMRAGPGTPLATLVNRMLDGKKISDEMWRDLAAGHYWQEDDRSKVTTVGEVLGVPPSPFEIETVRKCGDKKILVVVSRLDHVDKPVRTLRAVVERTTDQEPVRQVQVSYVRRKPGPDRVIAVEFAD